MRQNHTRATELKPFTPPSAELKSYIEAEEYSLQAGERLEPKQYRLPREIVTKLYEDTYILIHETEHTVIACLFIQCGVMQLNQIGGEPVRKHVDPVDLGNNICDAFECYCCINPSPCMCFEKTWGLYNAMVLEKELTFAYCADCGGPYVQDRYALDYQHCPFCDIKANAV